MRRFATFGILSLLFCVGRDANAKGWEEVHQTADDVRVVVAPDGVATFTHQLRYRIVAGRFKTLDVPSIDPRGELVAEANLVAEKGGEIPARVERFEATAKTPAGVHLVFDEGKGITRGAYVATVKYKLDLVAAKILARDGAMWKIAWSAPPSVEGRDGARVVFELPPAPTEPRLGGTETAQTTLATLRRFADKDELELVRPHVPRGETVTWMARIDPKALSKVDAPELRPPPAPVIASSIPTRTPAMIAAAALAALAGIFAFALKKKRALVARDCAVRALEPRPLVNAPFLAAFVPFAYGVGVAAAFAAFSWGNPLVGAVLVVAACLLATHRAPAPIRAPRRAGAWREVAASEVLVPKKARPLAGDVLDLATTRGKLVFAIVATAVVGLAWLLATRVAGVAFALPLSAVALVPIFATGSRTQHPATPVDVAARMLRPARDALAKLADLSHVELRVMGRVLAGTNADIDEVRLVCAPIDRTPGLRALELALAIAAPGPHGAVPEVLVRHDAGSPAAARIAAFAPGARIVIGRSADEKVTRLVPTDPTPEAAARLLAALIAALEGRRTSDRPGASVKPVRWAGRERRVRRWPTLVPAVSA